MINEKVATPGTPTVRTRKVLYLCGYDPRGASHYYSLYRDEAAKARSITGSVYTLSPRKRNGRFSASWSVDSDTTRCDYEFLGWDDIIRNYWPKSPFSILGHAAHLYAYYTLTGTAAKIRRISRTHFVTFIYPLFFLLFLLASSIGLALVAGTAVAAVLPGYRLEWLASALVAIAAFLRLGEYLEKRFNFYWLLRIYSFFITLSNSKVKEFDTHIQRYAEHLLDTLERNEYDEVLLVGHSVGTILLPLVVSRALELDPQLRGARARLALLTLGHCIQDVTLLPHAEPVRAAIRATASSGIFWLDVTSPPDGACFPLVDVAEGSGLQRAAHQPRYPLSISARFHKMFSPEHYRDIKRDRMRIHFQYLMAGDHPTEYNYFDITAGPLTLEQRYAKH
jgi:hypothetical protein